MLYTPEAASKITDIELECNAILHSFESTLKEQGPNSYRPFSVFFKDADTKSFVIISRPVNDEKDYYTAISEMLFTYSTIESEALLLAIDTTKNIDNHEHDVLDIFMACEEYCYVYSYPYILDDNNNFTWLTEKFSVYQIDSLEKHNNQNYENITSTIQIMEALFLHVYLKNSFFDLFKLKSFFDYNKFEYLDLTTNQTEQTSVNL